ncbi:dihydropteroate synthase [Crossiella sp. SN42]|uniref:dihydropteroate synthase n=1 Tax=Crossiella sp. SN42 TaxID=2944808 RepID=UPI00207C4756|nr:dihydropteroate synthase [Crossiella sp. SN42]MCO1580237.1 dihydropteroate synthase [Crossiella sp. SN42]
MVELSFRGRRVARNGAMIMAIINRTPDSFYDGGANFADEAAMASVAKAVAEGADIIDIGGVKAGPGAEVGVAEEIARTVPFVVAVRARFPEVVISIDTWRAEVARVACAEGADLINDTWAAADPALIEVAAEFGAGFVCSHTGGLTPRHRPFRVRFADLVGEVVAETTRRAESLVRQGVPRAGILIDPTHDFGKNTWHGLELLRRADELVGTGWPVLMALSNKDFVGETLGVPLAERVDGTLAATAIAAHAGAAVFRAHQVARTRTVLDTVATLLACPPST